MKGYGFNLGNTIKNVAAIITFSLFSLHVFAVSCGDTITSPTTLTGDLDCELSQETPVALTVQGPSGILNMNGFAINCSTLDPAATDFIAVELQGTAARISNGTLNNCLNGIVAMGDGFHQISNMTMTDVIRNGVQLFSDGNILFGTSTTGVTGSTLSDGVEVLGNDNIVSGCTILGDGDEGVEILGLRNTLTFSYVAGFSEDGLELDGDHIIVVQNTFENNGQTGVIINGNFATVTQNTVSGNGQIGINISGGNGGKISMNFITNNGSNASPNYGGIVLTDPNSSNYQILGNILSGNQQFDLIDLFDPNCTGSNRWLGNQFEFANPMCLR